MSVELTNKDAGSINPYHMKDGQLGIITYNPFGKMHEGAVVQKYGGSLIMIGYNYGGTWSQLDESMGLRVRLLKKGETITVVDN